jgi:beta-lactam-binding protein with PASTA domain
VTVPSLSWGSGTVFAQYPTVGTAVPPGRIVGYLVSSGKPSSGSTVTVTVPTIIGQTTAKAKSTLKSKSLNSVSVLWSGSNRPAGEVVGQLPEANATVPKNSSVLMFVSNGK